MIRRLLAAAACGTLLLGAAAPARYSVRAMQSIVDLSDAVIAPNGSQIAFVASRTDLDRNRYDDTLEIYDRHSNMLRAVATSHDTVDAIAWSPDGKTIAAVMNDPQTSADQLFSIDVATGQERRLTGGARSVIDFAWSPDGTTIAFTRRESIAKRTGAARYRDAFRVDDNDYLTTAPAQPAHLWLVDRAGNERRLTRGAWSVADAPLSWSPNGASVLYVRAPSGTRGVEDRTYAMRLDLRSGTSAPVTPHRRYEDQALYSPDGSQIAYLYSRDGDPMNLTDAMTIRADGRGDRNVTRALDRHVYTAAWMPNAQLLVSVYDRTAAPLFVGNGGSLRRLPLGSVVSAQIEPQGSVARDGTIAFVGTETHRPNELYVLTPGARVPQRLSHFNDAIGALQLGRAVRIAWRSDGFEEDGVLTYPPGYLPGRKYPLVLRIHGGPTESSMTAFEPFYQLAASHGYLVFAPNYRGSNDLGNTYEHAIFNDASAGPGRDIMAGIRAVERLGIVDTKRIAVSGWSYGGQLTSWMEGHYHIWRAAVAGAAVNDLVVDYAIADDIDADRIAFSGGSPFAGSSLSAWRFHSPITYFKNIHTPTLILCNVYDVRVPIVESYEMYHALRDNGVPVVFYAYPSTGHLPNGPVRLADAYQKWLAWFDRYLK